MDKKADAYEPTLKEQVAKVPLLPGVYLWKNTAGEVVYVGKAKQLRNRMMQYIMQTDERVMIPFMMDQVRSFDYIVTESEHEALVLEKNLINQYNPYYNVDFRDDKSYPYIAITKGDGDQVHAREAQRCDALLWPLHRCARRAGGRRRGTARGAHLHGQLRALQGAQAQPRPG